MIISWSVLSGIVASIVFLALIVLLINLKEKHEDLFQITTFLVSMIWLCFACSMFFFAVFTIVFG